MVTGDGEHGHPLDQGHEHPSRPGRQDHRQAHGHGHAHDHRVGSRRRLALVLGITLVVLVAEVAGAVVSGSLSLLADAGHVLTDAGGLVVALGASVLAARPPTDARTWGYQRAEVLAAVLQAAVLLAVGVSVVVAGVRRVLDPPPVQTTPMLVFAGVALAGGVASLAVLASARRDDLNLRAAFLEVAGDALGACAVIVAALVIAATGWLPADGLVSVLIGLLILPRTATLLREAADVLLESTPRGLDLTDVRAHLLQLPHVLAVHDLHASQVSTGLPVLTAHVVVDDSCFHDGHTASMLDQLQACVAEHFPVSVEHSTFQVEPARHAEHERAAHQ